MQAGCSFDAFGFSAEKGFSRGGALGGMGEGLDQCLSPVLSAPATAPPSNLASRSDLQQLATGGCGTCLLLCSCSLVVEDRGLEWIRATYEKRHTAGAGVAGGHCMKACVETAVHA